MFYLALLLAGSAPQLTSEAPIPQGNPADWIRYQDFAPDVVREAKRDTVNFSVDVDTAGKAVKCTIQQGSGSSRFDSTVCAQLMSNSRFQPMVNRDGKAISGQWTSRFRIANGAAPAVSGSPELNYDSDFEYRVDSEGKAVACRSIRASGIAPINCADALGRRVMTPPTDGSFKGGVVTIHTTRTFTPD